MAYLEEYWQDDKASGTPCAICRGPVIEFSVPNDVWNTIVRHDKPSTDKEYLCTVCFNHAVAKYHRRQEWRTRNDVMHWFWSIVLTWIVIFFVGMAVGKSVDDCTAPQPAEDAEYKR